VKRGTLKSGDLIVAGTAYAKVRRMTTSTGKSLKKATPGTAVEVSGWKERPNAGDQVLQASKESEAKLAIRNRIIKLESVRDQAALDAINEQRLAARRELWQQREKKLVAEEVARSGQSLRGILKTEVDTGPKVLRVVVKADVSGSAEAVEEAIKGLGNNEVKVLVVDSSVGEITESDVSMAIAADGTPLASGWH
jgi:translation initiation factor IF-2